MKIKSLILALVSFIAIMTYESCVRPPSCGCKDTCFQYFRVKKPAVTNMRAIDTSNLANLLYPIDTVKVTAKNFVWRILFEQELYCKNTSSLPSFFPTAAADIAPPKAICKEKIDSIVVTTVNDYDNLHLAGSQINDILGIQWYGISAYRTFSKEKLTDFLANANRPIEGELFVLYLRQAPAATRNLQVNIHIKISDGQVFDLQSQPLILYQ